MLGKFARDIAGSTLCSNCSGLLTTWMIVPHFCLCVQIAPCRRRALHKYDPVDLQKSFASAIDNTDVTMEAGNPSVDMSIRDKELAEAKTKGLLVDFGDTCDKYENNSEVNKVSPVSIDGMDATSIEQDMRELDRWDKTRGNDDLLLSDDDDSDDDDLL